MRRKWFWGAFLTALVLAGISISQAAAQEKTPVTDDQVNEVARQLYCPVCENTPLDVCPTTACAQWRALIREKLELGWSEEQINDYFVTQYGDRVMAEPPRRGLNWLVYVIPPVAILAAALFLGLMIRRMKKSSQTANVSVPDSKLPEDELLARVEQEIRRREK
jgi:cytochrome c-type biogenesis protein CcmH